MILVGRIEEVRYLLLVALFMVLVVFGLNLVAVDQNRLAPELPASVIGFDLGEEEISVSVFGYSFSWGY